MKSHTPRKYELDIATGLLQFMYVGSLAGVSYLRYTALTSPKKGETAVRCCDPALSVHVMLVSRNVFHVVSALQFILFLGFSARTELCPGLNPSPCNRQFDFKRICFRSRSARAEIRHVIRS